jgi:asparagine synthetase B (glutamine-hydrolysing)
LCSFLLVSSVFTQDQLEKANHIQQFRGPDLTRKVRFEDFDIIHNLLSITGAFAPQPFVKYGRACVFNGQIYNSQYFGDYESDGICIPDVYHEHGVEFPNRLDGEFAICIVDPERNWIVLSTDPFGTKPLHFALENNRIGVASYASALRSLGFVNVNKVQANSLLIINYLTQKVQLKRPVWKFDLRQYKMNHEHWAIAFENSIRKRTKNVREKVFIGLSSGYDSGGIACELLRQNVEFKSYTFSRNENASIIDARVKLISKVVSSEVLSNSDSEIAKATLALNERAEAGNFFIYSGKTNSVYRYSILEDKASVGLAAICARAATAGRKIYLSGQGGDEIMSDYGFNGLPIYEHSNFGGLYPENLSTIFPWPSFYGSTQEAYLMKDEYIGGAYSVETRYPFLDKFLVQEFLHLDHKLKNYFYKAPLSRYLLDNSFPIGLGEKFGFVPG